MINQFMLANATDQPAIYAQMSLEQQTKLHAYLALSIAEQLLIPLDR